MKTDLNSTDMEFLRLMGEGKEEEARQYAISNISKLSEDVREDVIDSLAEERLDLSVLRQEEEIVRRRKAG
jgi:hypothetical protein